jgi:hypothetical protein
MGDRAGNYRLKVSREILKRFKENKKFKERKKIKRK